MIPRAKSLALPCLFACALIAGGSARQAFAEEDLGTKIKKLFAQPTPPPKKHKTVAKKKATPSPSPSPKKESSPKPSPSPSPKKKSAKKIPGPTPDATETPTPKPKSSASPKKKKSSPTSEARETPSPSPSATPEVSPAPEESPSATPMARKLQAPGATVAPGDIAGLDDYPPAVRKVIDAALALTTRNLEYKYGSADPETGGMDCSGFIFYLLTQDGLKEVPRDASGQYSWVRKAGKFQAVISRNDNTFELEELRPGDLLFWTGTYDVEKDPPITHTMIYLGREKKTNQRMMVGASDGRTFHGQSRYGVGVFDFKVSSSAALREGRTPRFVGYGRIPGLGEE